MTVQVDWWKKPRRISVVVDNPSWILPFAERLVAELNSKGDQATLIRDHADISEGAIAFFLGCVHIASPPILNRNRRNLVVHESELPKGRGFSPLSWQILEGKGRIPICLVEAVSEADAGSVIYRDWLIFMGHELIGEMRRAQGAGTIALCHRFVAEQAPPKGEPQTGEPSFYPRRRPSDSKIDANRSIADQFDLLRIVDNDRYPAWFEFRGHRYKLSVEKAQTGRPNFTDSV